MARSAASAPGLEHGPTIAEQIARRVRVLLDYPEASSWQDLWYLLDTVFVDDDAADLLERTLMAAARGRIGPGKPGDKGPFNLNASAEESLIDPGDPPMAVPGLLDWVTRECHRQYRALIRSEQDPLSRMGLRKIIDPGVSLPFTKLRRGVLLDGLEPGSTMVVVGVPKSGKTYLVVQDVIGPALEQHIHVISNIEILHSPDNYHHVSTVSDYFLKICDLSMAGLPILTVRDEGALGRMRSRAQATRNQDLKMMTMVGRKFAPETKDQPRGGEVNIYQREGDVPVELLEFSTHFIQKPSRTRQDMAFINTPDLRQLVVSGIPGESERLKIPWKIYEYRSLEISVLAHDIDLLSLIEYQPTGVDGAPLGHIERLKAIRERILIGKGHVDLEQPFTIEQLIRIICGMHRVSTKWGYRKFYAFLEAEWLRAGVRSEDGVYKITKDLGLESHPDSYERWCRWCNGNRDPPVKPVRVPRRVVV